MDVGNGQEFIMVKNYKILFTFLCFIFVSFSVFSYEGKNLEELSPNFKEKKEVNQVFNSLEEIKYVDLDIEYPDHELILKYHVEFNTNYGEIL